MASSVDQATAEYERQMQAFIGAHPDATDSELVEADLSISRTVRAKYGLDENLNPMNLPDLQIKANPPLWPLLIVLGLLIYFAATHKETKDA